MHSQQSDSLSLRFFKGSIGSIIPSPHFKISFQPLSAPKRFLIPPTFTTLSTATMATVPLNFTHFEDTAAAGQTYINCAERALCFPAQRWNNLGEVRVSIFKDRRGSFRAFPPSWWIKNNHQIREICEITMQYHFDSPWKAAYALMMACQYRMEHAEGYADVVGQLETACADKYGTVATMEPVRLESRRVLKKLKKQLLTCGQVIPKHEAQQSDAKTEKVAGTEVHHHHYHLADGNEELTPLTLSNLQSVPSSTKGVPTPTTLSECSEGGDGADVTKGVLLQRIKDLEEENRKLTDTNKAMSLYITSIIERILKHKDSEEVTRRLG